MLGRFRWCLIWLAYGNWKLWLQRGKQSAYGLTTGRLEANRESVYRCELLITNLQLGLNLRIMSGCKIFKTQPNRS